MSPDQSSSAYTTGSVGCAAIWRGPDGTGKGTLGPGSALSLPVLSSNRYCATCSSPRHTTHTNSPFGDCTKPCAFLPAICESLGSDRVPSLATGMTPTRPSAVLELVVSRYLPLWLTATVTELLPPDHTSLSFSSFPLDASTRYEIARPGSGELAPPFSLTAKSNFRGSSSARNVGASATPSVTPAEVNAPLASSNAKLSMI